MRETKAGLEVKGDLVLEVQQAREALGLMKAGAVDALSIGFRVPKGGAVFDKRTGVRRLKEIQLLEVSLVTFPANPKARIERVKGMLDAGDLPSEREFECLLREAGLSQREAKAFMAGGYGAFAERRDPDMLEAGLLFARGAVRKSKSYDPILKGCPTRARSGLLQPFQTCNGWRLPHAPRLVRRSDCPGGEK